MVKLILNTFEDVYIFHEKKPIYSLLSKNVTLNKPEILKIVTFCYSGKAGSFLLRKFSLDYSWLQSLLRTVFLAL
jgi:hypothetical protein